MMNVVKEVLGLVGIGLTITVLVVYVIVAIALNFVAVTWPFWAIVAWLIAKHC